MWSRRSKRAGRGRGRREGEGEGGGRGRETEGEGGEGDGVGEDEGEREERGSCGSLIFSTKFIQVELSLSTVLQVSPWFQNEDPSSRLNSTPPIGAPNAAVRRKNTKCLSSVVGQIYSCL